MNKDPVSVLSKCVVVGICITTPAAFILDYINDIDTAYLFGAFIGALLTFSMRKLSE